MAVPKKVQDAIDRYITLVSERRQLNSLWEEIAEVLAPERRGFNGTKPLGLRTEKIYDTVPNVAKRGLVNAIGGLLRPKSSAAGKWFSIVTEDEALMEDEEVRGWIEDSEKRLWKALYNPKAKFIQATGEADDDIVTFGTAALFTGVRRDRGGLLFKGFHMACVFVSLDSDGDVDTVYLLDRLKVRAAVQRWGLENLGKATQEAYKNNKLEEEFDFLWAVGPRHDRDPRRIDSTNMPFYSLVVDLKSEHLVIEEGFEEFPFAIPRWDTRSGETYGRGPGVLALPDVLTLNQMGKTILRGLHRAVDPPWLLPNDSVINAPQNRASGITYYDAQAIKNLGLRNPFQQMDNRAQIPWGLDAQSTMREQVFALFYRNILNLPIDAPQMTATEVIQRREEFIREIGAVFGRLENDYSAAMIDRAFGLMARNGGFADAPEQLQDEKVEFRFASPIEKAREQIDETLIDMGVQKIVAMSAVKPEVLDRVNWDAWSKNVGRNSQFPIDMYNTDDEIQAIRDQRAEQQAEMAAVEQAGKMADVAKTTGEAAEKLGGLTV